MPPANNGSTRSRFTSMILAVVLLASASTQPVAARAQTQQQQAAPQSAAAPKQNSGSVTCSINPQTAPPLSAPLAAARDLYRTGKFDEAITAHNAIIPNGGDDAAAAYAGLARVYLKQKRVTSPISISRSPTGTSARPIAWIPVIRTSVANTSTPSTARNASTF
jgi:TolA-binding protein